MEIKMTTNNVENKENNGAIETNLDKKKIGNNKTSKQSGFLEIDNVMNLNGNTTPIKVKPKNQKKNTNTKRGLVQNIEN